MPFLVQTKMDMIGSLTNSAKNAVIELTEEGRSLYVMLLFLFHNSKKYQLCYTMIFRIQIDNHDFDLHNYWIIPIIFFSTT